MLESKWCVQRLSDTLITDEYVSVYAKEYDSKLNSKTMKNDKDGKYVKIS